MTSTTVSAERVQTLTSVDTPTGYRPMTEQEAIDFLAGKDMAVRVDYLQNRGYAVRR